MDPGSGAITGVRITDIANNGSTTVTVVDIRCAQALTFAEETYVPLYPDHKNLLNLPLRVNTAQNEDLVLVGYYFWVFGVSSVAVSFSFCLG